MKFFANLVISIGIKKTLKGSWQIINIIHIHRYEVHVSYVDEIKKKCHDFFISTDF